MKKPIKWDTIINDPHPEESMMKMIERKGEENRKDNPLIQLFEYFGSDDKPYPVPKTYADGDL